MDKQGKARQTSKRHPPCSKLGSSGTRPARLRARYRPLWGSPIASVARLPRTHSVPMGKRSRASARKGRRNSYLGKPENPYRWGSVRPISIGSRQCDPNKETSLPCKIFAAPRPCFFSGFSSSSSARSFSCSPRTFRSDRKEIPCSPCAGMDCISTVTENPSHPTGWK